MDELEHYPNDGIAFFETALGFAVGVLATVIGVWGIATLTLSLVVAS